MQKSRLTSKQRFGKCVTLHIPKKYLKTNIRAIGISSYLKGLNIFVHYPGQFYSGSVSKASGFLNEELYIDLKYQLLEEIHGRNCHFEQNGILFQFNF